MIATSMYVSFRFISAIFSPLYHRSTADMIVVNPLVGPNVQIFHNRWNEYEAHFAVLLSCTVDIKPSSFQKKKKSILSLLLISLIISLRPYFLITFAGRYQLSTPFQPSRHFTQRMRMLTKSLFLTLLAFTLPFDALALRVPSTVHLERQSSHCTLKNSTINGPPPPPKGPAHSTKPLNHTGPLNGSQSGLPAPPSTTLPPAPSPTVAPLPAGGPIGANTTVTDAPTNATALINATTLAAAGSAYDGLIASAWYPSWLASKMPVESIPWSKYNTMTFAFG